MNHSYEAIQKAGETLSEEYRRWLQREAVVHEFHSYKGLTNDKLLTLGKSMLEALERIDAIEKRLERAATAYSNLEGRVKRLEG